MVNRKAAMYLYTDRRVLKNKAEIYCETQYWLNKKVLIADFNFHW